MPARSQRLVGDARPSIPTRQHDAFSRHHGSATGVPRNLRGKETSRHPTTTHTAATYAARIHRSPSVRNGTCKRTGNASVADLCDGLYIVTAKASETRFLTDGGEEAWPPPPLNPHRATRTIASPGAKGDRRTRLPNGIPQVSGSACSRNAAVQGMRFSSRYTRPTE